MNPAKAITVGRMTDGVPIMPHKTVALALAACSRRSIRGSLTRAVLGNCHFRQTPDEKKLSEIIQRPIWYPFGGRKMRYKGLALASLDRPLTVHEFQDGLRERGFRPTGLNDGAAFIPLLRSRGEMPDSVLHLGTPIPDNGFREWYLVTRKNGTVKAVPLLLATKLPTRYEVVVEKIGK